MFTSLSVIAVIVSLVQGCHPPAAPPPPCEAPNGNSSPVIYGPNGGNSDTTNVYSRNPIAICSTCSTEGAKKNYWAGTDYNNALDVVLNKQMNFIVACRNWAKFCTCDASGNCCGFSGTQQDLASQIEGVGAASYCTSPGNCNTYTIISSNVPLTCGGSPSAASFDPTIPFTTAGAYFNGISYDCNSCDGIRKVQCNGPATVV